eukprot:gene5786-4137_t
MMRLYFFPHIHYVLNFAFAVLAVQKKKKEIPVRNIFLTMQDPDRCRGRGVCSPAEVGGGMPVSPPSEPPRRRQWLAVSLWCGSLLLLVLLLLLSTPGLLLPSAPWEPLPSPFSPSIRQGKEGSAPAPPRMNVSISRSTVPPPQSGEGKLHGHYLDALPSDFPVPSPEEIRRHKRHFSDTVLDPYELLLLTDFVQEDLQHSPLCYTFGYQIFAVMRLSPFSSAGIHINAASEESTALWAHTRRGGKENASVKANETLLDLTLGEVPQHVFSPSPAPGLPVQSTPIMNFSSISATAPLNASVSLIGFLDRYMVDEHVPTSFRGVLCDWFVQLLHLPDHPRPAVINLPKTHTFAFSLRCLYARTDALRTALRQFVLVTTEQDETAAHGFFRPLNMNPSEYPMVTLTYLLNHPLLAHWYSTNANIRHPKFTAIPIGFHFFHHSGQRSMPIPDWDSVFQSSTSEGWGENPSTERWGEEHRQKWDASHTLQPAGQPLPPRRLQVLTAFLKWSWRETIVSSYEALARYVHADEEMTYEQRCRDTDVESSDHPQPSPLSTASSQGETIQAPPPISYN